MILLALITIAQLSGLLVVVVLLSRTMIRYYNWLHSPMRQIPGPPVPSFFFGYLWDIRKAPYFKLQTQWLADARSKHDDVTILAYGMEFGRFNLLLLDVDLVKEILTSQVTALPLRYSRFLFDFIRKFLGDGLVTLEGPEWHRHRRIIQPSFYTSALRRSLDASVPKHTERFISAWRRAKAGRVIEVASHLSALTIDILGDVGFSYKFDALKTVERWAEDELTDGLEAADDPLISAMHESFSPNALIFVLSLLESTWLSRYIVPSWRRACGLLDEAVDSVVRAARRHKNNKESKSLLQTIFDAEDSGSSSGTSKTLTDRELRDEVKTFIVAGHETTSTMCYWALYALAKFPDIENRVYEDIVKHNADKTAPIHMDEVDQMAYLSAFVNEVLRMYPPVGAIVRKSVKEEKFGKYTIPAGTRVFIPIYLLHRHVDHWNNPLEFMPERWLDKEVVKSRHRYSFLPFGAGGHNCIGQNFALMEGKLMLANIIRAFTIELAPSLRNTEIELVLNGATLKAKPPIRVCIKAR